MHADQITHRYLTCHKTYQQQPTPCPNCHKCHNSLKILLPMTAPLCRNVYFINGPTVTSVPTTPSRFTSAATTGTAGLILCIAACKVPASHFTPAPPPDLELCPQ